MLSSARSSSLAMLFVSLSSTPTTFRCGTLLSFPVDSLLPWITDAGGVVALIWAAWPGGLSGQSLYFQYVIPDLAAPCGMAFSNALRADVP
ncbi:MAG: hypothetical protein AB1486_03180 [Planctomycetota bacterium]